MKKIFIITLYALLVFVSCDILRLSPFDVEDWTPGGDYHSDPSSLSISLLLTHDSDRVKVEQAFSLLEDGRSVKGNFSWNGRRMVFIPASPLEDNRDYSITLGTGAQDTSGLSLERKFEAGFSTRPPGGRLELITISPAYDGIISMPRQSVDVSFSQKITALSCVNGISFSPSVNGSWEVDANGKAASFFPLEPWRHGNRYRINISPGFKDANGRNLGYDFSSAFTVLMDEDNEKPFLLYAAVRGNSGQLKINENILFEEWESCSRLELVFSKAVDTTSVKSHLTTEPGIGMIMENENGFSESVTFCMAESPVWNERYLIRLIPGIIDKSGNESADEKLFVIKTNGPYSKPPEFAGIRLPMAPGNIDIAENDLKIYGRENDFDDLPISPGEDRYPYAVPVKTWIELYFETASDSAIDPLSIMELFRVEATNGAVSFSPRNIVTENFTMPLPEEKWESLHRIEIQGYLTNTVNSGIVSFVIPQGLKDILGNQSQKSYRISLLN